MGVWGCFHRPVQALSDDQQIERLEGGVDRLEKKMDDGFTAVRAEVKEVRGEVKEVRGEARADFRTLIGIQLTTVVAMVLGFAALLLQHHL
jgi:hypothetical protein